jgi:hypothetical protein
MSVTLFTDKKPQSVSPKGEWLFPQVMMMEVNRLGQVRYPAVKARGTLTLALNVSNGETVLIDSKTYVYVNTLTGVDGQVKIGATKEESIANLIAAINLDGTPNSQYTTQTTLHPTVYAKIGPTTAKLLAIAKVGGNAGNSIVLGESLVGAGNQWDAATLGTTVAGADESDADSLIQPHYYGGVNNNSAQQYNVREMYYHGGGEEDASDDRLWQHRHAVMNFPMKEYKLLAGAVRKFFMPNHLDRLVKRMDVFNVKSFIKRPEWQSTISSPFAESTGNITFHTVEMGDDRFALFYRQQGGTTGIYVIIGQLATNGVITWGTPTIITTLDQYDANFDAVLVSTNKILCTFGHGASTFTHTATITVSGTVASVNTPVQVVATNFTWKKLCKLDTDKALLAVYTGTTLSIYVVTITGTVPSYGSVVNQTNTQYPHIVQNGTDKAQLVFWESSASRVKSSVITVTGTTPTIQASIVIGYEGSFSYKANNLVQVATDKFVYYHYNGNLHPYRGRDRAKFIMLTITANTTAISHTLEMRNTVYDGNLNYFKKLDTNTWMIWNKPQNRVGKMTLDLTNNQMTINDIPYFHSIWDTDGYQTNMMQKRYETNNIQRSPEPALTTNGWVFLATDNNVNGGIVAWTDKTFSFEVYLDDELFGTFNKTIPGAIEGVIVRIPLNRFEAAIKIKNPGSVDLFFMIPNIVTSIE